MWLYFLEVIKTYFLPFSFGMIPLIIWLIFFLLRDWKHPEPKVVLLHAFLMGIASTLVVLFIQNFAESFSNTYWPIFYNLIHFHDNFNAFLWVAIVEEVVKFLMIYFTLHRSKYLDEAIDPMIYMVVCAIGFSSIENYFSIFDQLHTFVVPFQTLTARFLGANLLHIICSGVIGFFWSMQIASKRKYLLGTGLVLAILFHALFNTLIFTYGIFAVLLMFTCVFVGASILLWLFDVVEGLNVKVKSNTKSK